MAEGRITFKVTDYPKGHRMGRDDRAVRIVDVRWEQNRAKGEVWPIAQFRFSKNWNPRQFEIEEDPTGRWSGVLTYLVGHGNMTSERAICFNFECRARTEDVVRDFLKKKASFADLKACIR